jgi:hypothetical protein
MLWGCGKRRRIIWERVGALSAVRLSRREKPESSPATVEALVGVRSNKTIALLGSDTLVGQALASLSIECRVLTHTISSLDFSKPGLAVNKMRKGNPDSFVCCITAQDTHIDIVRALRAVKEAAESRQIIGFSHYDIYRSSMEVKTENSYLEQSGPAFHFERELLKHKNPTVFRLGEVLQEPKTSAHDMIKELLWSFLKGKTVKVVDSQLSFTSPQLLCQAVKRAVEWSYIEPFNLVLSGEVSQREVVEMIIQLAKQPKWRKLLQEEDETANWALDNSVWKTFSMTNVEEWENCLKRYIQELLGIDAIKREILAAS